MILRCANCLLPLRFFTVAPLMVSGSHMTRILKRMLHVTKFDRVNFNLMTSLPGCQLKNKLVYRFNANETHIPSQITDAGLEDIYNLFWHR